MTTSMDVLLLSGVLADPFDGVIRILCDVQRFGLALQELHLEPPSGHGSKVSLTLLVPPGSDADVLRSRFERHVTVVSVGPSRRDD